MDGCESGAAGDEEGRRGEGNKRGTDGRAARGAPARGP
jgi:hypothetical protein